MNLIKGSLIVTVITNIVKAFEKGYDNSALKKNVSKIASAFKNSRTHKVLSCYINKNPYYRNSVVYKIIMAIAGLFDKLFGKINVLGTKLLSGSIVAKKVKDAYNSGVNQKLFGFGVLFMSIPLGSLFALICLGQATDKNMAVCWGIFAVGVILVITAVCKDSLKNSKVIKAVSTFFELIR